MDNHNHITGHGHASLLISLISGVIAWVNLHTVPELLKTGSAFVSIFAGIMAIRYYYYATKKAQK